MADGVGAAPAAPELLSVGPSNAGHPARTDAKVSASASAAVRQSKRRCMVDPHCPRPSRIFTRRSWGRRRADPAPRRTRRVRSAGPTTCARPVRFLLEAGPMFIRSFDDLRLTDVGLVGGKNASLGELIARLGPLG